MNIRSLNIDEKSNETDINKNKNSRFAGDIVLIGQKKTKEIK